VEEFENIIVRANPDGSIVRMKDVARVELGSQTYNMKGRINGEPSALISVYQVPGSNALDTMNRAKALLEELKTRFPEDLDYQVSLRYHSSDRRHQGNVKTLFEAIASSPPWYSSSYKAGATLDPIACRASVPGRNLRCVSVRILD
jgi:HAE1 family hydrophobic/amphiphilic exporter-1